MPNESRRAQLSGPGVTEINAVASVLRRTASLPPQAQGVPGSVRQRPLGVETREDGTTKVLYGPSTVFSVPHLVRTGSEVDQALALRQAQEQQLLTLKGALRTLSATAESGVSPASPADIERLIKDLDLSLELASTSGDPVVSRFQALTADLLGPATPGPSALGLANSAIDSISSHDFSQYVFGRDPSTLMDVSVPPGVVVPPDLDEFLARIQEIIHNAVYGYCQADQELGAGYFYISFTQYFPGFVQTIYRMFSASAATEVYGYYRSIIPGYPSSGGRVMEDVLAAVEWWITRLCQQTGYQRSDVASSFDSPTPWETAADEMIARFEAQHADARTSTYIGQSPQGYSFQPYSTSAVNFGLRLVYRQYWRPLGNQIGEIVRTIPLGPRQSEKVSFKSVVSKKDSRTSERATSQESSDESSKSSKDSSEVMKEAADKFKWNVDAEAGVNYGAFSAKLSAGLGGENSSNSKDTKSRINEAMSKTASRMKMDTKQVVSTETTRTDETSRTSEITNPNDEVAVTYVYSKLLRQYGLYTELAEANSVIFVPEAIPPYDEVDAAFVRRNALPILKVLLDPIYEEDVRQLVSEPDEIDLVDVNSARSADVFKELATSAKTALQSLPAFTGQYLPDFLSPVVDAQMRDVNNARAMEADKQRRAWRRTSLFDHLRRNILHYMRAIWSEEDRDQRWLRYARIQVPTRWTHDGMGSTGGLPPRRDGRFRPDYSPESMAPLVEVINPAGPIGFIGNYAIYLMKGSPRLANMNQALAAMRAQYVQFCADVTAPAGMRIRDAVVYEPVAAAYRYTLTWSGSAWTGVIDVEGGTHSVTVGSQGMAIDIDSSVRVFWEGTAPATGAQMTVSVLGNEALQDPEILLQRLSTPLPPSSQESLFFSEALLQQMAEHLPDVAAKLGTNRLWAQLDAASQELVRKRFHAFLLVRGNSTRIALDTNNLVLDLEVGKTPALETFKRLHRYIDVLKELEERLHRRLENVRRVERLQTGNFADPDIERVTLVGSGAEVAGLVDGFDEDSVTG